MYNNKKYKCNVYWGKMYIRRLELETLYAKKLLSDYVEWWERFINYCHTGK